MEIAQKPKTTPKDFFLYLGAMVALYISVISLLTLMFSIIDQVFPRQFEYIDPYAGGVSLAMAMLIVAFPLSLFFIRAISRAEIFSPEKREIWIRRAFIYCTLFVVVFAIAVDFMVLLSSFFSGQEITYAFVLKVLSVIVVLASVASYYLHDLKRLQNNEGARARAVFAYGGIMFVILALALGFWVMGSPYAQKEKRMDAERVNHLQMIQGQVVSYWRAKQKLPKTLEEMKDPLNGFLTPLDPKSKSSYEYVTTGKLSFQLCAVFSKETLNGAGWNQAPRPTYSYPYGGGVDENWEHGVGKKCFDRTIDPDFYQPLAVPTKALRGLVE